MAVDLLLGGVAVAGKNKRFRLLANLLDGLSEHEIL